VAALNAAALREWTPIRVFGEARDLTVEWAVVERSFSDPFFEQTAGHAMQHPFNALFARRTPVAQLEALADLSPGVAPTGFIFHMSRCGSTLIAQMLARLSDTIVLSEPQPFDALLRLRRRMDADEELAGWLRGLMSVLGRSSRASFRTSRGSSSFASRARCCARKLASRAQRSCSVRSILASPGSMLPRPKRSGPTRTPHG
jgi:hypothetical protein